MIPGITENFPSYATLHQATISLEEMGNRVITTQVKIDGDITPDFSSTPWTLIYEGEVFTLNTHTPQATKDTTTRCSLIDLTFESEPIRRLKQYFFVELAQVEVGTMIINKFVASLRVNAADFITRLEQVIAYYFGTTFTVEVASGALLPTDVRDVELNYTYIWDAIGSLYSIYGLIWRFEPTYYGYKIVIGDTVASISDHIFQYGYSGGLTKIERQIQDADIYNQLFGRGGTKNLPYRYFKKADPNNPNFAGDPDACAELELVYFDRLVDSNFRYYIKGWLRNPNRPYNPDYPTPSTPEPSSIQQHWAYQKGLTDTKFDPVEYVQDLESITEYGIRQGKLEDDDEVFPTIQGLTVSPYGRVDEVVAVGPITDGDDSGTTGGVKIDTLEDIGERIMNYNGSTIINSSTHRKVSLTSKSFYVEEGFTGVIEARCYLGPDSSGATTPASVVASNFEIIAVREDGDEFVPINDKSQSVVGERISAQSILVGGYTYHLEVNIDIDITNPSRKYRRVVGLSDVLLISTLNPEADGGGLTFQIWVKNIWNSTQGAETDIEYADRIWVPILGDREGNEAKIVFSDGALSASSDYEFTIVGIPQKDRSKTLNGVSSEWCITLKKSDAEFDATGKLIPNTESAQPTAGNHFFFIGIDMPYFYTTEAEKQLNAKKQLALDTEAYTNPTWAVQCDAARLNTLEGNETVTLMSRLNVGTAITIFDPRFTGGQNLILTIRTLNITWSEGTVMKPNVEILLSENVLARIDSSQTITPTEINAWIEAAMVQAAEKAVGNASRAYVSKQVDDTAYGKLALKSGATFGSFIGGLSGTGASIDGRGHGEMESLTLRKFLEVPELRYNRTDIQVGNYWRAPGGGIIEKVEIDYSGETPLNTGTIYLKLEDGEIASVSVDDICMGIFHNAENNASEDSDDSKGNFHFAGFSTVYFKVTEIQSADGRIFKYELRPTSEDWTETNHPVAAMTYVAYGNFSDTTRQTSRYSTRTYERYLKGVNTWELSAANVAAQFGELSNLTDLGITGMTGYSAYLENIYMTGFLTVYNSQNAIVGRMGDMSDYIVGSETKKYPFWIGGATPVADGTNFKIDSDGYITATGAIIQGLIIASSGQIGPFIINYNNNACLYATAGTTLIASSNLTPGQVDIGYGQTGSATYLTQQLGVVNSASSQTFLGQYTYLGRNDNNASIVASIAVNVGHQIAIGTNAIPAQDFTGFSSSFHHIGLHITAGAAPPSSSPRDCYNYGIKVSAKNGNKNYGIYIDSTGYSLYCPTGKFAGWRPATKVVTASVQLGWEDTNVIVNNLSTITVTLPTSPIDGQIIFIHHVTTNRLYISSGTGGKSMRYMRNGDLITSQDSTNRELAFLTYVANYGYWVLHLLHI